MKNFNFKIAMIIGMILVVLISCSSNKLKTKSTEKQIYKWENKVVSKRKYDKLLYQYTYNYIKNSSKEEQELLIDLIVVYDTLPKNKKD
jgi:disulfide oxidoreductase YuzD